MKNDFHVSKQRRHRLRIADISHHEFDILPQHAVDIFSPAIDQVIDDAHNKAASS
jgi:hypothetical protein